MWPHTYVWFDYFLLQPCGCHLAEVSRTDVRVATQYVWKLGLKKTMSVQSAEKSYHFSSLGVCVVLIPWYSFQLSLVPKWFTVPCLKRNRCIFWAVAICCLETYPSSWHFTHVTLVQSLKVLYACFGISNGLSYLIISLHALWQLSGLSLEYSPNTFPPISLNCQKL